MTAGGWLAQALGKLLAAMPTGARRRHQAWTQLSSDPRWSLYGLCLGWAVPPCLSALAENDSGLLHSKRQGCIWDWNDTKTVLCPAWQSQRWNHQFHKKMLLVVLLIVPSSLGFQAGICWFSAAVLINTDIFRLFSPSGNLQPGAGWGGASCINLLAINWRMVKLVCNSIPMFSLRAIQHF